MTEPTKPLDPAPADVAPRGRRARAAASRRAAAGRGDTKPKPSKPAGSPGPKGGRPSNLSKLEAQLAANMAGIGTLVMLRSQADGLAIVQHAPICARSLRELAEQNSAVRKALEGALTGSAWTGVVFAFGSLFAALAANHGLVPAALGHALSQMGGPNDGAGEVDPETTAAFESLMSMLDGTTTDGTDDTEA